MAIGEQLSRSESFEDKIFLGNFSIFSQLEAYFSFQTRLSRDLKRNLSPIAEAH